MFARRALGLAAVTAALAPSLLLAQPARGSTLLTIGAFTSVKECTIYQESAGTNFSASSGSVAASRYGIAATRAAASYSTWRTWFVKDCIDRFESLRTTLRAAIASVGHGLAVANSGGRYSVTGSISDVRDVDAYAGDMRRSGFSAGGNSMEVTFNLIVRDRNGKTVFGRTINKAVDLDRSIAAGGFDVSRSAAGEGLYTALEREVAVTAARLIAFHFSPLRVESVTGKRAVLNYGAPTIDTGDMVQLMTPDGRLVKLTVAGSVGGRAIADVEGGQDISVVPPGTLAEYLEPSSAAANSRRFERVDLP